MWFGGFIADKLRQMYQIIQVRKSIVGISEWWTFKRNELSTVPLIRFTRDDLLVVSDDRHFGSFSGNHSALHLFHSGCCWFRCGWFLFQSSGNWCSVRRCSSWLDERHQFAQWNDYSDPHWRDRSRSTCKAFRSLLFIFALLRSLVEIGMEHRSHHSHRRLSRWCGVLSSFRQWWIARLGRTRSNGIGIRVEEITVSRVARLESDNVDFLWWFEIKSSAFFCTFTTSWSEVFISLSLLLFLDSKHKSCPNSVKADVTNVPKVEKLAVEAIVKAEKLAVEAIVKANSRTMLVTNRRLFGNSKNVPDTKHRRRLKIKYHHSFDLVSRFQRSSRSIARVHRSMTNVLETVIIVWTKNGHKSFSWIRRIWARKKSMSKSPRRKQVRTFSPILSEDQISEVSLWPRFEKFIATETILDSGWARDFGVWWIIHCQSCWWLIFSCCF